LLADGTARIEKRVAILGGSTTHDIRDCLELFLLNHGIAAAFYESEYAQYWQDAMFPHAGLEAFKPDVIWIHTSLRNFAAYEHFEQMWRRLATAYNVPLIQNNFEYPFYRLMGNKDATHGKVYEVAQMNLRFAEYARQHDNFYILDINWLSADYGLKAWSDPFYWYMYKYALCLNAIPYLAHNVANIIKSLFGKNKKALALDLDNTLWGGVVGDDGAEGIAVGQETPTGQVYSEFQAYIKAHKDLGVILNVNSKNDTANALAGLNRPDSTLTPEDFILIKANWDPKPHNLTEMAAELSLGADAFVFVDDNPAERELVKQSLPGVAIPEMDKPEHYICAIDRAGYFEVTAITDDDAKRNGQYKANAERSKQAANFIDYHDYLLSLEMTAEIKPFDPMYMSRIAQLTNKSNQFNLTTKRYTQPEIEAASADPGRIALYGKLVDKFGDNGVVTVTIGRMDGETLHIELWLMSCRVLKREMENALLDELVRVAKQRGITELRGYYYPTAKNAMVKDFYPQMGFETVAEGEYTLQTENYEQRCFTIHVN
jgi:FkbH-like protein